MFFQGLRVLEELIFLHPKTITQMKTPFYFL